MAFLQMCLVSVVISIVVIVMVIISILRILKDILKDDYAEFKKEQENEKLSMSKDILVLLVPLFNIFIAVSAMIMRHKIAYTMVQEFYSKKRFTTPIYPNDSDDDEK